MEHFQLRISTREPHAVVIALLQKHTDQPLGQIRRALIDGEPVVDVRTHASTYDDFITDTRMLMDSLETNGTVFQCMVDGVEESAEYIRNLFEQWKQIGEQLADEDERRAGG